MSVLHRAMKIATRLPIDLVTTLAPLRHGGGDRTIHLEANHVGRALWTPEGPATIRLRGAGLSIEAEAWGPGADWALAHAGDLCGASDSLEGFEPTGLVAELHRAHPGLRIPRARTVFACTWPTILEQKVTGLEAFRAVGGMMRAWGHEAPGPLDLRLPPRPEDLARQPYYEYHPFGVERRRAEIIREAARRARRLETLCDLEPAAARGALTKLPGIGVWTAAEVARSAFGDPDAVSVGDYHLKNTVAYNLAGEPRADDARMLELLEPFAGHRGRVQRLLEVGGKSAPRYGPRMPVRRMY
jgi:3-methyladenine DNA glycosylase/8-oxoguanine DNA glycosylase